MSVDGYGHSASHGALTGLTNDDHPQYARRMSSGRWEQTSDQTIENSQHETLVYQVTEHDEKHGGDPWSMNLGAGVLTILQARRYRIEAALNWRSAPSSATYVMRILRNGSQFIGSLVDDDVAGGFGPQMYCSSGVLFLAVDDTIEVTAYQATGGNVNTNGGNPSWLSIHEVW